MSPASAPTLPEGLAVVPIDLIHRCPIQPRVNVSVDLVEKLKASIQAGRHQPVLEVEGAPGRPGLYQIVCGEQRWRAAQAAGLTEVLVRLHRPLGYLERLEKQYEENHLRAGLDNVESAWCLVLDKTIRDIAVAERLLRDDLVPFQPLDEKRITDRDEFGEHLDGLKRLLVKKKVHVVRGADGRLQPGQLSLWRETEKALGISETQRKAKLSILRLPPDLLEEVRDLPAEHAVQIARLDDRKRQAELVDRARGLTGRELESVVDRLRQQPDLPVAEALSKGPERRQEDPDPDSLAFERELETLADLCRQLSRLLSNLGGHLDEGDREVAVAALLDLRQQIDQFLEAG